MKRMFAAALTLTCAAAAQAQLVTPTSIEYLGTGVEFYDDETHLIDGSGLSEALASDGSNLATVTHGNASADTAWVTDDPNGATGDYYDPAGAGGTVVFGIDLGGTYTLHSLVSWAYHFGNPNGNYMSEAMLEFSTDGGATYGSSQTVATPLPDPIAGAALSPLSPTEANYVRLTATDNYFEDAGGGDRVGLAEIRFLVPEPASIVLLGLGVFGLSARRRRS